MTDEPRRTDAGAAHFRLNLWLLVIVLAFVGVSTTYNVTNPIFEAPDEVWHYLYVRHVAETGSLPRVDDPTQGALHQQEAFQAPLYYLMAALLTSWAPRGDVAEIIRHNFAGSMGNPEGTGNRNMSLHGPEQRFPYHGEVLTVHLVRLVTTLWGAATLVFTFLAARQVFDSRNLALAATVVVAFTPEFLFMSAAVNNDVPVAATTALLFWLSIRAARQAPSWRGAILLGIVAGTVILTKSIAAGTAAVPVVAIAWCCWKHRFSLRFALFQLFAYGGFLVATTSWWFLLNRQIYGSATPLQAFLQRNNLLSEVPSLEKFVTDLPGLELSYWAVFGWFNILVPEPYYWYFEVLVDLALLGLIVRLIHYAISRDRHSLPINGIGVVLALTTSLAVVGAVFVYRLIVLAFHGRLLFGAISAFACLFVLGWSALVPYRWRELGTLAVALSLVFPAVFFPWAIIRPAYAQPVIVRSATPSSPRPVNLDLGGEVTLLAVDTDPPDGTRVQPGDSITVTLYLKPDHQLTTNYILFIQLIDPVRGAIAKIDTHPGHGALPTSIWTPGQTVADQYRLRVPPDASGPIVDHVVAGFYREGTSTRLPITSSGGEPAGDAATVMSLVVSGAAMTVQNHSDAVFRIGDRPTFGLLDHQPGQLTAIAGSVIAGSLTYSSISLAGRDYTVFVHLDGPTGPVAQDDGPPRGGAFPTTAWRAGDVVVHDWKMQLPPGLAPGTYQLKTGWYDAQTGQRLTTDSGDSVEIGTVRVDG